MINGTWQSTVVGSTTEQSTAAMHEQLVTVSTPSISSNQKLLVDGKFTYHYKFYQSYFLAKTIRYTGVSNTQCIEIVD